MGLLLVAELVAGVIAFTFRSKMYAFVIENAGVLMTSYNESDTQSTSVPAWNHIQTKLVIMFSI